MAFARVPAVNTCHVSAALNMVDQEAYDPDQFQLHPRATEVVIQGITKPPQAQRNSEHHERCHKFIKLSSHDCQRGPGYVIFRLGVVNKYARQVKEAGKPRHNKHNVQTLNPKHLQLHAGVELNSE